MINGIGELYSPDGSVLLKMWETIVPCGRRPLVRHSHIRFEMSLIEDGSGEYTLSDKKYEIRPGDFFVFAGNEQHFVTDVGENGLKMINLHFEPRYFLGRSFDSVSAKNAGFCFQHGTDFENRIDSRHSATLCRLMLMIADEFTSKNAEYKLQIKSLVNLIIVELIRNRNYISDSTPLSRNGIIALRSAIEYIDTHLSEQLTLPLLAETAGMTPNYFSSLFKSVSGITLWDYINSRRIEAAMRLLKSEKALKIIDIAEQCGFNNTANFNKFFKRFSGTTPKDYRNSNDDII